MTSGDIAIFVVLISYIVYRTLTPKKGDTTSTPGGRFFGAVFKSLITLFIVGVILYLLQLVFVGSSLGGFIGILSILGR